MQNFYIKKCQLVVQHLVIFHRVWVVAPALHARGVDELVGLPPSSPPPTTIKRTAGSASEHPEGYAIMCADSQSNERPEAYAGLEE